MAQKIKDLIAILKTKDQDKEVEFIIVTKKGMLVCMDVSTKANDMAQVLTMFNQGEL